jgi:hypothetical protein
MVLPLGPTDLPGVYRRGSKYVVVYRAGGRQRKQAAATLAQARAIKLARDAEARAEPRGPTLHAFALGWLDRYECGRPANGAPDPDLPSRYITEQRACAPRAARLSSGDRSSDLIAPCGLVGREPCDLGGRLRSRHLPPSQKGA